MKKTTINYFQTLALVLSAVLGLGLGMVFLWLGLVEEWGFGYFAAGFIMVILGMFAVVILFSE